MLFLENINVHLVYRSFIPFDWSNKLLLYIEKKSTYIILFACLNLYNSKSHFY